MLLAERPLACLQGALEERLGFAIAALGLIERRQIVDAEQACRDVPCRACARSPPRRAEKRLGLAITALGPIQHRQIVHADERIGMLLAEHALLASRARL